MPQLTQSIRVQVLANMNVKSLERSNNAAIQPPKHVMSANVKATGNN